MTTSLTPTTQVQPRSTRDQKQKTRKRLLVLCPYPIGVAAGQRLKYEQYIQHWQESGYDVRIAPFMDMAMWSKLYVGGHTVTKVFGTLKGYLRRSAFDPTMAFTFSCGSHRWAPQCLNVSPSD